MGNSAPAPAHFSPIYSAPGLVPSLVPPVFDRAPLADLAPGLPPVERGPVVAVVALERVRFALRTQAFLARHMRGAGGLWVKTRGALEAARECGGGWVAWSEPVAGGAA